MDSGAPQVLLITPPFTQLNTPYPATPFLKGFLNTRNIPSRQADLGLEVIHAIFSPDGIESAFDAILASGQPLSAEQKRMLSLKDAYMRTISPVMDFLRGKYPALAQLICSGNWLPEGPRFRETADLEEAFGTMGTTDRARHLATLYLEDLSDLVSALLDPHFGFSRYAERLGRSPATFDELDRELQLPDSFISGHLVKRLELHITTARPSLAAITVPFPGNLFGALKCGQHIRKHHPEIRIVLGGGYAGTELRSLADPRVFDYTDYIILDDGEAPLLDLLEHFDGNRNAENLKRTFTRRDERVVFCDGSETPDVAHNEKGTPDYAGLPLGDYLQVTEVANPMHRLWSDGRWNRLTFAHGCYWGKCTFCDTSLDYIGRYDPCSAGEICDRMERLIAQTGERGFHFVDEAAPPALMKELALEILRRGLSVVWWTNIRFEKHFTRDLCRLLHASGCIAVSGGLEVASDRILKMIGKGVTVSQVAEVTGNFTRAGIMVHAYLMYGFPTQTAQETIDSLEMVRQFFMNGLIRSGFWHLFTMTAHSPVGMNPAAFGAIRETTGTAAFANNDLVHTDPKGCDHEAYGEGLRKALYNYMHGLCFDYPLRRWFGFDIPATTVAPSFIRNISGQDHFPVPLPSARLVWAGGDFSLNLYEKTKKGKTISMAAVALNNINTAETLRLDESTGKWLFDRLTGLRMQEPASMTLETFMLDFPQKVPGGGEAFAAGPAFRILRENGLLLI